MIGSLICALIIFAVSGYFVYKKGWKLYNPKKWEDSWHVKWMTYYMWFYAGLGFFMLGQFIYGCLR